MQCFRVSIPPAVRPTVLRHTDMGSLTCAHIWVLPVHTKGWGGGGGGGGGLVGSSTDTRVDSEGQKKNCPSPCPGPRIEPRVFGFEFRPSILCNRRGSSSPPSPPVTKTEKKATVWIRVGIVVGKPANTCLVTMEMEQSLIHVYNFFVFVVLSLLCCACTTGRNSGGGNSV